MSNYRFWTDYPLQEFGDSPNHPAPKREATPVSYDGDRYVTCLVHGLPVEFKAGYLYDRERQGMPIQREVLNLLPLPVYLGSKP